MGRELWRKKREKREYETSQAHTFSRIFHEEISSFRYFFKKKNLFVLALHFCETNARVKKRNPISPRPFFRPFLLSSLSFSILSSPFPH